MLATDPVDANDVRAGLDDDGDLEDAEVLVVSPAVSDSPAKFWTSNVDEAIDDASSVAEQTAASLREEGAKVRARTGDSEPLMAIQDALATYPADRILIFAREGDAARYREENVFGEVQERFGVPVVECHRRG